MDEEGILPEIEEKRREYEKQRRIYLEKRAVIKAEISVLEKELDRLRPRTEHGKLVCNTCDCISMRPVRRTTTGTSPGQTEVYECEICGQYDAL